MRLTLVHQVVTVGFMVLGIVVVRMGDGLLGRFGPGVGVLAGGSAAFAFSGPIFRWICLWPLMPRCPRCGGWISGVYRRPHPEGLLVVATPCGHGFVMAGEWVAPPFRDRSRIAKSLVAELGAAQAEGRAFRPDARLSVVLLDDEGEPTWRRRARWPHWFVRWKDVEAPRTEVRGPDAG